MRNELVWLLQLFFWPRRVAAGAAAWSWPTAWGVHLAGLVMGCAVLFHWTTVEDRVYTSRLFYRLTDTQALVGVLSSLLSIEFGFFVVGLGAAAWGAGDEKCSRSIAAATKRLFALTPHLALVGGALLWVVWWFYEVINHHDIYDLEMFGPLVVMAVIYYAVVLMLTTIAAGRSRSRCRWPAQCEGCNYSLMHLDSSGCCPECGLPVERSRSPEVRQGLWRNRSYAPWVSLWCLFHPMRCGAEVQLFDPRKCLGRCFVVSLVWVAFIVATGIVLIWVLQVTLSDYFSMDSEDWFFIVMFSVMDAGVICLFVLLVTLGTASLSGWAAGRGVKRNLMLAAMQLAARMSGAWCFLVLFYLCEVAVILVAEERGSDLDDWARAMGWDAEVLAVLISLGPGVLFLLLWTVQLARATRAARFSNV